MKTIGLKEGQRKAISPVIATVILIAITLIAAIAIGGFVFGIFGTQTSPAQVSVTGVAALSGTGGTLAVSCAALTTGPYVNIQLTNAGTGATTVTSISLTAGGSSVSKVEATPCSITASGSGATSSITVSILPSVTTTPGETFVGSVTLSNGAQLPFTGTFA